MRVAEDNHITVIASEHQLRCRALELMAVADVYRHAAQCDNALGAECRILWVVHVSIDSFNGRDRPQPGQHGRPTHVARMENQLHTRECLRDLWTHEAVRIRNETHDDRLRTR